MRTQVLGRSLISATAVAQMVGPFVFDFNDTHIYNPSWPAHAKFHNAQTSQLSAFFYPGTASVDPPGKDNWPQLRYTIPILTVIGTGWALARRGLGTTRRTR